MAVKYKSRLTETAVFSGGDPRVSTAADIRGRREADQIGGDLAGIVLPNGKTLGECSNSELIALGADQGVDGVTSDASRTANLQAWTRFLVDLAAQGLSKRTPRKKAPKG
ncbi:hypothetical protein [Hyphomicrobium sp. D-2]|uniref:hypothetical protein n=1 Tax=Hyphomicrobium sp. D-2 TaxID=3041621 RepID=UPI002455F5D2|nr:hypothetical protein [Hyphomicrobium sp. D-2]MDH4981461.1 hypothetical protein [Hyphomicrobium sp. D-2]